MRDGHCLINLCRGPDREWLLGDQGNQGLGGKFDLAQDRNGYWYWFRTDEDESDEDESKTPATSYQKPVQLQDEVQKKCVIAFIVTPQTSR